MRTRECEARQNQLRTKRRAAQTHETRKESALRECSQSVQRSNTRDVLRQRKRRLDVSIV